MNVSTERILRAVTEKGDTGITLDELMVVLDPTGIWSTAEDGKRGAVRGRLNTLRRQGYIRKVDRTWKVCDTITPEKRGAENKRLYVTYEGETRLLSELCAEKHLPYHAIKGRLANGWPDEVALRTPLGYGRDWYEGA